MYRACEDWTYHDLRFVVQTLVPERADTDHVVDLLQDDQALLEAMLQDERLFQQLMAEERLALSVSPALFFKVLLLRARRDLERAVYTIEQRQHQKVVLFDANQVVELLARPEIVDYMARMLASFMRINCVTIPVRVRPGIWNRVRVSDLDVDTLISYAQMLDEEHCFWVYQRVADVCLFLTGIFPEHVEALHRYPLGGRPRIRLRSSMLTSLEDYEAYGQSFYRLAASQRAAQLQGLDQVLSTLAQQFVLAEKPLSFLANRYLALHKHRLFASGSLSPA